MGGGGRWANRLKPPSSPGSAVSVPKDSVFSEMEPRAGKIISRFETDFEVSEKKKLLPLRLVSITRRRSRANPDISSTPFKPSVQCNNLRHFLLV